MRKIRMKVLVVMSVICLSASAQTESSGIAGASPRLVRAHGRSTERVVKQTPAPKKTTTKTTTRTTTRIDDDDESAADEVRDGFRSVSRGVGHAVKDGAKSVGKATRKIGQGGKNFFKKLGKGISDAFKPDTVDEK